VAELVQEQKKSFGQAAETGNIRKIAHRLHIPENLMEDAVQEGWLAHLSGKCIQTALRRWGKQERSHYQHEHSVDPKHMEIGIYGYDYQKTRIDKEALGLHYDKYHGWIPDDIDEHVQEQF